VRARCLARLLLLAAGVVACSFATRPGLAGAATQPGLAGAATRPGLARAATRPGLARAAQAPPQVRIAGGWQTVFDWATQACAPTEGPDLPARAFRDYRGRVQLLLSHYVNFRLVGPSLERLHRDCRPVLRSPQSAAPSLFEDREWIASLFTTDGRDVWALVDEEYQGNRHPGSCPGRSYFQCWYNAVTLVRSTNGGRTYVRPPAPRQLVAASPERFRPGREPVGVFTPSNIVTGPDGARYALVRVRNPDGTRGVCLLRARQPGSPTSWRAWTGSGFAGRFADPYGSPLSSSEAPCAQVGRGAIAEMTESLTYNTVLHRYLLVGLAPPGPESVGAKVTGIYFSTSTDLVDWTPRQLIAPAVTVQGYACGGSLPIAYPSVIDPRSRSRTYATSGRSPFLYFTQFDYSGCRRTEQRNLIRVPLEVSG